MFSATTSLILALHVSILFATTALVDAGNSEEHLELGSRDRFWKHHVEQQNLVYDGVDQYNNMK